MPAKSSSPSRPSTEPEDIGRFIGSASSLAICTLTVDGVVRSWNRGGEQFTGHGADEVIGRHFSLFFEPEDQAAEAPRRVLEQAAALGCLESEGWCLRKDGSRFWASSLIDAICNDDGVLIGFTSVFRDVTAGKKRQEAQQAREEQFRLLVQGVTDYAIYMISPLGLITNWNAGAERFKGYTEAEVLGTHFSRFYTREDRGRGLPDRALDTALQQGRYENEGWRVRKDGTRFWAHVIIDPIFSDLGELIGFGKITRDITERRETELALEKAKEALFQSQKLEALGKLTGGIAHDFNNLLAVISNGLEIIGMKTAAPELRAILDSMKSAAVRGARLNQQLLTFARKQPLQFSEVHVNELIYSFEDVLRRVCDPQVGFEIDLGQGLHTVMLDAVQFEAALLNLVTNSRDAMSQGGRLRISTSNVQLADDEIGRLPAGHYVRIAVSDTGSGIPSEIVGRVIEPFFTTKPVGEGTGLGLSQVYGLVQESKGELKIDSIPEESTTIAMYLPAHSLAAQAEPGSEKKARVGRALIVDDQSEVLTATVQLFRIMEFDVLSASSGTDALRILQHRPDIDLLFTDVIMPGMNGVSLAIEARKINPDIEVLLASGYPGEALVNQGHDAASFTLIRKPYSLLELVQNLGRFMNEGEFRKNLG